MKSIFNISRIATLLLISISTQTEEVKLPEDTTAAPTGVLNNLLEMDTHLFEELIAGATETSVKNDQTWLIFFDSYTCKRCPEVYEVFLDLSNVQGFLSDFKLAHL